MLFTAGQYAAMMTAANVPKWFTVVLMIMLFIGTAAVSAFVTYKLRRKNSGAKSPDEVKNTDSSGEVHDGRS